MIYQYDLLCPTLTQDHANLQNTYLAKLLSPVSTSEYTVKSTSDFITHIKEQNIPNNFKLISFDVTSLFTNVPLDFTIDVILKQVYDENEENTNIPK